MILIGIKYLLLSGILFDMRYLKIYRIVVWVMEEGVLKLFGNCVLVLEKFMIVLWLVLLM